MSKKKRGAAPVAAPIPKLKYVGPHYRHGIRLELGQLATIEVRPRDFDTKMIRAFQSLYPQYANWWTSEV